MKSLWPVYVTLVTSVISVIFGIMLIKNTHQSRMTWNQIEILLAQKEELNIEYTQLRLEESMLATGVILDKNIRTHLDMVIPDPATVVYVQDASELSKATTLKSIAKASK